MERKKTFSEPELNFIMYEGEDIIMISLDPDEGEWDFGDKS